MKMRASVNVSILVAITALGLAALSELVGVKAAPFCRHVSLFKSLNGMRSNVFDPSRVWNWITGMVVQDSETTTTYPEEVGVRLLDNGYLTFDADTVASPRFVLYGDQWVEGQPYGAPPPWNITGFDVFNLAFWTVRFGAADNAAKFAANSAAGKKRFKRDYARAGMKLMVSVFGATDLPQSMGQDATQLGKTIATFVKDNGLDGVDVDYEEFDLFEQGEAVPWLIQLTRSLRTELPSPNYLITHAPIAPWFNQDIYTDGGYATIHREVGDLIDWYNVQFYNQETYETCDSLIWDSGSIFPQTSLFEINKFAQVPLDKLVVGKPAIASDAGNGFMKPLVLGSCLETARINAWKAGIMFWEYPHMTPHRLGVITDASGLGKME